MKNVASIDWLLEEAAFFLHGGGFVPTLSSSSTGGAAVCQASPSRGTQLGKKKKKTKASKTEGLLSFTITSI